MNEYNYMDLAIKHAKKGALVNEVPIAALLVDENKQKIYSIRHNEIFEKKNPLKHAEILVINDACRIKKTRYLTDLVIFVTLEPCAMCAAAISEARIKKVYFGAYDEKKGAIESKLNIFSNSSYFIPQVYGGIREQKCSKLLKDFFKKQRKVI
tara:strand:+ start:351 stop:809 length:459 start_codon:yes stop_codon:yes gene_type:complete